MFPDDPVELGVQQQEALDDPVESGVQQQVALGDLVLAGGDDSRCWNIQAHSDSAART